MKPKPIDAHSHLYFEEFEEDRQEVIESAQEDLQKVVVPGVDYKSNRKAVELSNDYSEFIVPNLGLHPTYKEAFDNVESIKSQIREANPAAIGEIGLDHHHVTREDERTRQRKAFKKMLELAEQLNKPVVVHSREAEKQAYELIQQYNIPKVFMHCFNGKPELAEEIIGSDTKIGVTTQILYSTRVQNIVGKLDVEDIVLETDSPFLYQGERNQPSNVLESAKKIADMKEISTEEVVSKTTQNSMQVFDLEDM
jgi:Mg-dependent DNase